MYENDILHDMSIYCATESSAKYSSIATYKADVENIAYFFQMQHSWKRWDFIPSQQPYYMPQNNFYES